MTEYSNGILFDRNILVNYSCFISLWLIWIITFHPVRGNFANEFYSYENCASNFIQKLCSMVLLCRKKNDKTELTILIWNNIRIGFVDFGWLLVDHLMMVQVPWIGDNDIVAHWRCRHTAGLWRRSYKWLSWLNLTIVRHRLQLGVFCWF